MPTIDVELIESATGTELPSEYRAFLLDYPADALAECRRYDLFDDPAAVVEETLVFRRYLADEAAAERYLVIGDSGCGDRVCLDVATATVLFWSHTDEDFHPLAESIGAYYRLAVAEAAVVQSAVAEAAVVQSAVAEAV